MKAKLAKPVLIMLLLAAIASGAVYLYSQRWEEATDDATLNGRTVSMRPKISGYVKTLNINDNQLVKAGDVLLEIDPGDYILRRDKAQAVYEAARAAALASHNTMETTTVSAPSNRDAAAAQVDAANANLVKAEQDLKRMQRLSSEARSQGQLDQAVAAEKAAKSSVYEALAKLRSAETAPKAIAAAKATKDQLAAQFKQAAADLALAESDLANTKLIASMAGRITNRAVERGDYVQIGQHLGFLVGMEFWVTANFKESQLTHMRPGQAVKISVDAFPAQELQGKVESIQSGTGAFFSAFPPQNATGNFVKIVQRVPVKIIFQPPPDAALPLGPGMSVIPTVNTAPD
jgi:membrane fusion protein (multidrug efflux system)